MVDGEVQPMSMSEWAEGYPEYAADAVEAIIPLGQTGAILTTLWLIFAVPDPKVLLIDDRWERNPRGFVTMTLPTSRRVAERRART